MKKTSFIIVVLVFHALCSQAQETKSFRFGLKGSPTLAWLKPDMSISDAQKLDLPSETVQEYTAEGLVFGFSYGIMGEFAIGSNYAFATGFDVTYNGGKLKYPHTKVIIKDTVAGNLTTKYNLKYLEIPLLLKMKTNEIGYITYFGQFGFGTSFNLTAMADQSFVYSAGSNGTDTQDGVDIKNQKEISFFRESLIIGAGIEYSLGGNTCVIVGVNFNNGFTDVLKGENDILNSVKYGKNSDKVLKEKAISNYLELNIGILF